jgi:hypothetical protein
VTLPDVDVALRLGAGVAWDDGRLGASRGAERAVERHPDAGYAAAAWIPRGDWRALDRHALPSAAPHSHGGARATTVGLCIVTKDLVLRLRAERRHAQSPGSLGAYAPAICRSIEREWAIKAAPVSLSLGHNPGNLPTVTRDPVTGELVGLHLDTFHDRYDAARSAAGNRISVNVGTAPRYLLFAPHSLRTLHRLAGAPSGRVDLAASFFERNQDRPILRLRVDPGEAYIAPTESLLHDGSSAGNGGEDLHVTGRGAFDPC